MGRIGTGRTILLCLLLVPFVYPFIFLAMVAVRTRDDYIRSPLGLPTEITGANLARAWELGHYDRAILNSFTVSLVSSVTLVVVSALAAFWFVRHRGRLSRVLYLGLVSAWLIPLVIYVIPLFVVLSQLGLTDNLVLLGILIAAVNVPFGLFLTLSYLRTGLPAEVLEAARVDGASVWQEFHRVVLPLARPVLGTLAALGFISAWGDLLMSLILIQSADNYTMTIATSTISQNSAREGEAAVQVLAAAGLTAMLPLAAVFLLFQRAISRGLTAGVGR